MFRVFRASELEHSNLKEKGGKSLSIRNKAFPFGNSYSFNTTALCWTFVDATQILGFFVLKQWKSNDIPSTDYYAIIIVVYYKK